VNVSDEFSQSLRRHQSAFDLALSDAAIDRLTDYHAYVMEHNRLLHLVAPCSAEEFATRHILESLTLLEHLPKNERFADIGAGAGLPSIPCLLVREDLQATLIESKEKKCDFLQLAAERLRIDNRVTTINRQFTETQPGDATFVSCRALDKFSEKLPGLLKWSGRRSLLLFGGENIREDLQAAGVGFVQKLMPLSERRFLFSLRAR